MGALMRGHDWSTTPLGAPENWPQSLRTTVRLALTTRHPVFLFWGPELICLYNDAYSRTMGPERHPSALGRPGREVWDETWHIIGPQIDEVMSGRGATWHENQVVPMTRHGRREDVWWTYSYSPIDDESAPGGVGGVLVICNDVTEQHRARAAIAENEERFRAVFDSRLLGLTVFDAATGRTLVINDRALEIIDCTREEFERGDRGCLSATPPEYLHLDHLAVRQVLETGRADPFEKEYARKDGTRVPVRLTLAPLPGQPGRAVVGIEDLTEQKASERAARDSEARFRALADLVPNFVWFAAPDGTVHYLNDRWYEYTGQAPEEALRGGWVAALHPDDAEQTARVWGDAQERGATYEGELRLRRHDGEFRWYIARAVPVRDAADRIVAWFGSSTDIHDRKVAEAALAESESRFRNMADNAPVMIWTTDQSGFCGYLNRAWREFTGQGEGEGLGLGWADAVHPEDRDDARTTFMEASAQRRPFRAEYRLRRADGTWRWAIDAAAPRLGDDGEFLGMVGSVIDITERKMAEEQQVLLMRELDHRAKNALAVVHAAVRLTPKDDINVYVQAVEGRVKALARAHSMLAEARWEGAELRALLQGELAAFVAGQRAGLSGPTVALASYAAQGLAMVVHELATNAVKHGALSTPAGRITVNWSVERVAEGVGLCLHLRWAEEGGPTVSGPPDRRGFGTRVLDATVRTQLRGKLRLDWAPGGLTCEMEVPLRRSLGMWDGRRGAAHSAAAVG
jgi:PAS domain S-box-containing protein